METYHSKYIKYKTKYGELRFKMDDGNLNKIVHISGSQGSGKTALGNILKDIVGDLIIIKDLDILYDEFVKSKETNYQMYVDNFEKNINKIIIFTNLDDEECLGDYGVIKYNLHATYKFYISVEQNKILEQRFNRQITKLYDRKKWFFDTWLEKPDFIEDKLFRFIDLQGWIKEIEICSKIYKKKGYDFMEPFDIILKVLDILPVVKKSKIIFINGKGGSGKSTLANKISSEENYFKISLDEIVKKIIIPSFPRDVQKDKEIYFFGLYRDEDYGDIVDEAKEKFKTVMKKIINIHDKIVVEGTIKDIELIKYLFGQNNEFRFMYVQPKSKEEYTKRLTKRFIEDPDNYGRLGFIESKDKDGKILKDYKINGINSQLFKQMMDNIGEEQYKLIIRSREHYEKHFDIEIKEN